MPGRDPSPAGWIKTTPRPGAEPLQSSDPAPSTTLDRVLIVILALSGTALVMRGLFGA